MEGQFSYQDFDLLIKRGPLGSDQARVLRSPAEECARCYSRCRSRSWLITRSWPSCRGSSSTTRGGTGSWPNRAV